MINSSYYRGYEILIDTQNGGWTIKLGNDVLCSQPTQGAARRWIDTQNPTSDLNGETLDVRAERKI